MNELFPIKFTLPKKDVLDKPKETLYRISVLQDGNWFVRHIGLHYTKALKILEDYKKNNIEARMLAIKE